MLNLNIQTLEMFGFSSHKSLLILSFSICLKQVPTISSPFAQSLLLPFFLQYKKNLYIGQKLSRLPLYLRFGKSEQDTSVLLPVSLQKRI